MEVTIPVNLVFNSDTGQLKIDHLSLELNSIETANSYSAIRDYISQRVRDSFQPAKKTSLDKSIDDDVKTIHGVAHVTAKVAASNRAAAGRAYWAGKKERNECARKCTKKCTKGSSYCVAHKAAQSLAIKAGLTL